MFHMMKQFRCMTCRAFLFSQNIISGTVQVKCKNCGRMNVLNAVDGGDIREGVDKSLDITYV